MQIGNANWINQDNFFVIENNEQRDIHMFCVLDGHGEHGHLVSKRCRDIFPTHLTNAQYDYKKAFLIMQNELTNGNVISGTCYICIYRHIL